MADTDTPAKRPRKTAAQRQMENALAMGELTEERLHAFELALIEDMRLAMEDQAIRLEKITERIDRILDRMDSERINSTPVFIGRWIAMFLIFSFIWLPNTGSLPQGEVHVTLAVVGGATLAILSGSFASIRKKKKEPENENS